MDFLKALGPRNQSRTARPWYSMKNLAGGEAEILVYDFIGFDPWFGGVSALDFVQQLRGLNATKILLRINSPGGDITEAVTMRNALREHPAAIETHIDGIAASSASWLGLVADKVIMSPHAMMMIHEPWNVIAGDATDMRKAGEVLDKFGADIASMYAEKGGGTVDDWRAAMREETWYTDQEAVTAGLADEVATDAAPAENRYDPNILNIFKRTPAHLLSNTAAPVVISTPDPALVNARLNYLREQSRRLGVAV